MLSQESRTAYYSRTPRVWPSEASASLFDTREAGIIGGCHRKSYFRLTGEPQSNTIDVVGARRFRTGRAMELDIISLAKAAGIFVAAGVRYHVEDIDLPLEMDLIVYDKDAVDQRAAIRKASTTKTPCACILLKTRRYTATWPTRK